MYTFLEYIILQIRTNYTKNKYINFFKYLFQPEDASWDRWCGHNNCLAAKK